MKRLVAFAGAACLSLALALPAAAGGSTGAVFPPDSSPRGMTHAEWQGAYQIWFGEIPSSEHPAIDPSSARNCELQHGIVFLGPIGADCTVPAHRPLAFSPAPSFWECSTGEGLGETFRQLRRCARENFAHDINADVFHMRVVIDGQRLRHVRRWISQTPGEIIDFPEDNFWNAVPGPSKSVTKGFLFILRPLGGGNHTIRVNAVDEVIGSFTFVWRLHVAGDDD
jgi:hypothetical protein